MPSLVPGGRKSGLNRGNLMAGAVVILLVGAFFFLPELVTVNQEGAETDDGVEYVEEDLLEEPAENDQLGVSDQVADPVAEDTEPLLEELSEDIQETVPEQSPPADLPPETAVQEEVVVESEEGIIPAGSDLSWSELLTDKSEKHFGRAREGALKLARDLPEDFQGSRFALLAFANGIDTVLARGKGILESQQAVSYMDRLDRAVTAKLKQENVPRVLIMEWSEVSLGKPLQSSAALTLKQEAVAPYDPRITLIFVRVFQEGKKNVPDLTKPAFARVRGFVIGRDTRRFGYYVDQDEIKVHRVHLKPPDGAGRRFFKISKIRPIERTKITFRAEDVKGNVFKKSYQFLPKAARFGWHRFPEGGGSGYRNPFKAFDPRYDSYYRLGYGGKGDPALRRDGGSAIGRF